MRWSDQIELIPDSTEQDEYGDVLQDEYGEPIPPEDEGGESTPYVPKIIFANEVSVRQSEFYQAHAVGLKPERVFEVWCVEYEGEKRAKVGGVIYHIMRTYTKDGEKMELILSRYPMEG